MIPPQITEYQHDEETEAGVWDRRVDVVDELSYRRVNRLTRLYRVTLKKYMLLLTVSNLQGRAELGYLGLGYTVSSADFATSRPPSISESSILPSVYHDRILCVPSASSLYAHRVSEDSFSEKEQHDFALIEDISRANGDHLSSILYIL